MRLRDGPRARQQPCLTEGAPFPIRLQTVADLAAARFGLYAWEHPFVERGAISPFWHVALMLPSSVEARATPLSRVGLPPGMAVEELRLLDGRLEPKLELGPAAAQFRLASGRGFDTEDGMVAQHDLWTEPKSFIRQLEEACALAAGNVPRVGEGWATGSC